jgi:hypothetical protein
MKRTSKSIRMTLSSAEGAKPCTFRPTFNTPHKSKT